MRLQIDLPDETVTGLRRVMLLADPKSSVREQAVLLLIRYTPIELERLGWSDPVAELAAG